MEENTSGLGEKAVVPNEIRGGWNWGAFLLNWIWGIGNNTFIAFLCWVPFVNIVMPFVLGAKGNEWAWRNKRWDSVEHFKRVQKTWTLWGVGVFVVSFLLAIAMGVLMAVFAAKYGQSMEDELSKYEQQYEAPQDSAEDESSAMSEDDDATDESAAAVPSESDELENTPAFDLVIDKISNNEKIMDRLGDNAEYHDVTGTADDQAAEYTFTVKGDKAGGTVHATAVNKNDEWVVETVTIDMGNGKPVDLNK